MKRYEANGTITIRCYAENEEEARKKIRLLASEMNSQSGVHISMGEHHQVRGQLVVRCIDGQRQGKGMKK